VNPSERRKGQGQGSGTGFKITKGLSVHPVQPGWVIVPDRKEFTNEWYHLVGWTNDMQPVIAMDLGVAVWRDQFGEDRYSVATIQEWCGE
jgi:hypothetical protein